MYIFFLIGDGHIAGGCYQIIISKCNSLCHKIMFLEVLQIHVANFRSKFA